MAHFHGYSRYIDEDDIIDIDADFVDEDIDEDGNDAFFDNDPFFAEPKKHNKVINKSKLIMMMPMMFFSMFIMFCRFIGEFMIDVIDDLRD